MDVNCEIIAAMNKSVGSKMKDLTIEITDVTIDNVLSVTGSLLSIPIFSLINNVSNVGLAIRDKKFAKNVLYFLNEFNKRNLSKEKIDKHIDKLSNDPKTKEREMEIISVCLDTFITTRKAEILANLYFNYLEEYYSFEDLKMYATYLDNYNIYDGYVLEMMYNNNRYLKDLGCSDEGPAFRLHGLGFMKYYPDKPLLKPNSKDMVVGELTITGLIFYEFGLIGIPRMMSKPLQLPDEE